MGANQDSGGTWREQAAGAADNPKAERDYMTTQNDSAILAALQSGDVLTPAIAASRWGCLALHSAIARLRKLGHDIPCRMVTHNDRRHGEYRYVRLTGATKADGQHGRVPGPTASNEAHGAGAAPSATADQLVHTVGRDKDGKRIEFSYVASGFANGRPVRG